jgi:hypothetical protein
MFLNFPTPPLQKQINLKGLPNTKFSCMRCHWHRMQDFCVQKSIISRRIRSRNQNGFIPWLRGPGYCLMKKNQRLKISWDCPFRRAANISTVSSVAVPEPHPFLSPSRGSRGLTRGLGVLSCWHT